MRIPGLCQHAGERVPGCETVADPEATLSFGDVEPGMCIHYCAPCGASAKKTAATLMEALKEPSFMKDLERALDQVDKEGASS